MEQVPQNNIQSKQSAVVNQEPVEPKVKAKKVIFDKSTNPFTVIFTERGFLVEDTRMSFEEIKRALDKEYNITLERGSGIVLDAIKMQKIMKYENLFKNEPAQVNNQA
jgi:hypothetical protein